MNGICPNCNIEVEFHDAMSFSRVNCPECNTVLIVPEIYKNFQLVGIEEEFSVFKKYKCYDLNTDKELLITILNKKFSGFRECINYCRKEAKELVGGLKHSGIVPILEYGEHDSTFYFTEPYSECFKLSEYDCQFLGEFDVNSVFNVFKVIGNIIASAHNRGFIHHNICSENILIGRKGDIKLQNYLISRVLYQYESENNIPSTVSPFSISPEKAEKGIESKEGDIFSLGVALYYTLTGEYPFDGEVDDEIIYSRIKKTGIGVSNKIINHPYKLPVSIDRIRKDVPFEYSGLIAKMLKPFQIQRPKAAKFVSQLNFIEGELKKKHSMSFDECFDNIVIPKNITIKSELKEAIDKSELELRYQPIINLKTNTVPGFEVLVRWPKSPEGNDLPESFIPNIKKPEIIRDLGLWVVDNACRQLIKWNAGEHKNLFMIVNVSPEQIKEKGFKESFGGIIKKYNLGKQIIPELSRISSYDKSKLTEECYEDFLQFFSSRISLDEITSKYKTFQSKFAKLHIHSLIIDNAYLKNINKTEVTLERLKKVIAFANSALIETVAEKIETKEELELISKIGCSFAQGYYLHKPMTGEKATELLDIEFQI